MNITISPIRGLPGQPETILSVSGDVLTVGGIEYDLSAVPEGGEGTPDGEDHPFAGAITRQDGVIHCTVKVFLDETAETNQPTDPAIWSVSVADGPVPIPAERKPEPEDI